MGKASEEWKGKWKTGRKLCVGRSQVLQKVNQIVIVLMMKKIPVSLQSTHSVVCIRVISHRPNKNNSASALQALCSCSNCLTTKSLQLSR